MTLKEKQFLFMQLLPRLLDKINESHFCTGGDLWSQPAWGVHKRGSMHYIRLAIDINLFTKSGEYLSDTESHKPFGEFWESLHTLCRWGGRFQDGNHYSVWHIGK